VNDQVARDAAELMPYSTRIGRSRCCRSATVGVGTARGQWRTSKSGAILPDPHVRAVFRLDRGSRQGRQPRRRRGRSPATSLDGGRARAHHRVRDGPAPVAIRSAALTRATPARPCVGPAEASNRCVPHGAHTGLPPTMCPSIAIVSRNRRDALMPPRGSGATCVTCSAFCGAGSGRRGPARRLACSPRPNGRHGHVVTQPCWPRRQSRGPLQLAAGASLCGRPAIPHRGHAGGIRCAR